ncbi:MAG: MFS transporter [Sphingobium sp.]
MSGSQTEGATGRQTPSDATILLREGDPPNAYSFYVLGLLCCVGALNFLDRQIITILLVPIKEELQVSDTAMGFVTGAAFAISYMLAVLPLAYLAERVQRRKLIACCISAWSLMTVFSGMVTSYAQMVVCRAGVAAGEAGADAPSHSMLSDFFPARWRARASAVLSLGHSLGIFLGLAVGGYLAATAGWRVAYIAVGAFGIVVALLVWTIREPRRGGRDPGMAHANPLPMVASLRVLWRIKSYRYAVIATAFQSIAGYSWIGWMPTLLIRIHHLDIATVGLWMGLAAGLGVAAGVLLSGVVVDGRVVREPRWYSWIPGGGSLVSIVFSIVVATAVDASLAIFAFIPFSIIRATWGPPTHALCQNLVGSHMRATSAAVLGLSSTFFGLGIGPIFVGVMNDLFNQRYGIDSIRYSLLIATIGFLLSAIFYFISSRYVRDDLARSRA